METGGPHPGPLPEYRERGDGGSPRVEALRGLIMLWFFLSGLIGAGVIGPTRSSIMAEFGLSHFAFGVLIGVTQIVSSGGVLLCSALLRRVKYARVLMAGLVAEAAGFFLVWGAPGLWAVVVGWGLVTMGVAVGALFNNVSMDLWPHAPRRGVILLHAFNSVGKVVGPLVVGMFLLLGWRSSFLAVGGLVLMVAGAFAYFYGSLRSIQAQHSAPAGATLRRPMYWACILPFGLIAGGEYAFASLLPAYLETAHGISVRGASLFLALHLAGLAAGRFGSARLTLGMSNRVLIGACVAMGVFAAPVLYVEQLWLLGVFLFLAGFQFSGTWPLYYAQVSRHLPAGRDTLAYGSALGTYGGFSVCILLSSWIADWSLAAGLISGPAIVGLFGVLFFMTRLSAEGEEDTAEARREARREDAEVVEDQVR